MKSLQAQQIRTEFLEHFQSRDHQKVRSSSMIPSNAPNVLLTTAGMQQFKPYFLGEQEPGHRRLTSIQKCFRTSDIDEVGDETHNTFFEMLGNFSVGDYFKKEAIDLAWELLVEKWGIPSDRLSITVFGGEGPIPPDHEAEDLWKARGVSADRIYHFGPADNFWGPPGITGPCGPCSEIHYDVTRKPCQLGSQCGPNCSCGRFLEIWNLVFMQYNKQYNKHGEESFDPLPAKNIDTGMGLERITLVLQNKPDIFSTDLFSPLLEATENLFDLSLNDGDQHVLESCRIVADHIRGATFLVSDGVLPSNEGRGYVLRRILRRSLVHGRKLGQTEPFVNKLLDVVIQMYDKAYPELAENRKFISRVLGSEEQRFLETLETGIRIFQTEREKMEASGQNTIPGPLVFKLYDTYGFPPELTEDMAREQGLRADLEGFELCMKEQKELARASWRGDDQDNLARAGELADAQSEFLGYDLLEVTSVVTRVLVEGEQAEEAREGEQAWLVTSQTPFYAESGGQVGDQGRIEGPEGEFQVLDTRYGPGEVIMHQGKIVKGRIRLGEETLLRVDGERRKAIARNHTVTHLLQHALRSILGDHVRQSGSLVAPDRLRFDFTHFSALEKAEIESLESQVNRQILHNHPLDIRLLSFQEARAEKAIALFGEKYGEVVRLVSIGDFSKELCGGTHVKRTGDIGLFKILHEASVAAGVRRIEALTGEASMRHIQQIEEEYRNTSAALQARPGELVQKIQQLQKKLKEHEKNQQGTVADHLKDTAGQACDRAESIGGVKLVTVEHSGDATILRSLADMVKDRLGSGVVLVASREEQSVLLILAVTKDLTPGVHAGNLIREVAKEVGGKGGGRPDMAQAGGSIPERLEQAFGRLRELLAN